MGRQGTDTTEQRWIDALLLELRVLVVAGVSAGVLVAGCGSRVAMLILRFTSPDTVRGRISDDGFEIGRFTLGGTYNLCVIGAAVGLIGAATYRLVASRLIGPRWFRRSTVALACAVVVGSMLVHDDGIDFHALQPMWLAIGLFVALPAAFGFAIAIAVDRTAAARPTGWRRWLPPVVLLACFAPAIPVALFIGALTAVLLAIARIDGLDQWRSSVAYVLVVRGAWMLIAALGSSPSCPTSAC